MDNSKAERIQETHDVAGFNLEFSRWGCESGGGNECREEEGLEGNHSDSG